MQGNRQPYTCLFRIDFFSIGIYYYKLILLKCYLYRSLSQNNNRCGISQNEPTPAIEVVVMYDFVETHKGI